MLRRNKETVLLRKRGNEMVELLRDKNLNIKHSEDGQLTLILGEDAITAKLRKIMENYNAQFCVLCPRQKFFQFKQLISEAIHETLKRKVALLLITENSVGPREAKEIRDLRKNPAAQIKYLQSPPSVCFAVFDKKEIMLAATPKLEYSESSVIWSNNPSLIELALSYFERLWNQT